MIKFSNFKKITFTSLLAVLMAGNLTNLPAISVEDSEENTVKSTGYITPDSFSKDMKLRTTFSLDRTITVQVEDHIETTTAAPKKLDILFLADNTDSMGPAIQNVQDNARTLLTSLSDTYDDLQVGVARYYGDPKEKRYSYEDTGVQANFSITHTYLNQTKTCVNGQGASYPCYKYHVDYQEGSTQETWTQFVNAKKRQKYGQSHTDTWTGTIKERVEGELGAAKAYELQTGVTDNLNDAIAAINNWDTSAGGNWKEGNFFALHQAATNGAAIDGYATGHSTNWRSDAKKIIVWFGDAQSHIDTVSQPQVVQALANNDISVVAIHTKSTAKSETQGLNADSQASSIASKSNGAFASVYSSQLADTMEALIGTAAVEKTIIPQSIDLSFATQGNVAGLNVTYTCVDQLGCDDVKDGETRSFKMDVTAEEIGSYTFKTIENTTGALANNIINVYYPAD